MDFKFEAAVRHADARARYSAWLSVTLWVCIRVQVCSRGNGRSPGYRSKDDAATTVRFRTTRDVGVSAVSLAAADPNVLAVAHPWREFRWRAGQKHYSGPVGRLPRVGMSYTSRG